MASEPTVPAAGRRAGGDGSDGRDDFEAVVRALFDRLRGSEVLLANLAGETTDFVRFNGARVRQAGTVEQRDLTLCLVEGARQVGGTVTLSGDSAEDRTRGLALLAELRGQVAVVPDDPHLLYATEISSSERIDGGEAPAAESAIAAVRDHVGDLDLTGLWMAGRVYRGFASSLGQRNWHATTSFLLDFSLCLEGDLAVKAAYAGTRWDLAALGEKLDEAGRRLGLLRRPAVELPPGAYDAYLEPAALGELVELLGWGGFGLRAQRTKSTPLIRMCEEDARLHPSVHIVENTAEGVAPSFQAQGFRRPPVVELVGGGRLRGALVSPRSAREFGVATNGASPSESPESIDVAPGEVPRAEALGRLRRGVWLGNLHYLNFSDRRHCRTTGVTRFACFLVEGGEVVAPIRPMRFDETLYRLLGDNLLGLTRERELLVGSGTYGGRSTTSARLPGALVADLTFTL